MSDEATDKDGQETAQLADFLPYQLSVTSNAVSGLISRRYGARYGLKIPEWRIMAILGDTGNATQRKLTDATLMDKVAVNRACKVLEERGLVTRLPNTQDGRSHLIALTDDGRALHDEVMPMTRASEREIFTTLTDAEGELFLSMLRRLMARVREIAGDQD